MLERKRKNKIRKGKKEKWVLRGKKKSNRNFENGDFKPKTDQKRPCSSPLGGLKIETFLQSIINQEEN